VRLSYETERRNSIAAEAERAGRSFGDLLIDRMLARPGGLLLHSIFNQELDAGSRASRIRRR
jgi:hypothetical protein